MIQPLSITLLFDRKTLLHARYFRSEVLDVEKPALNHRECNFLNLPMSALREIFKFVMSTLWK